MNTGAIVIEALGDESATFNFNLAPSAHVLTVTRPDGSVVRHVTIEAGPSNYPPG